MSHREDKKEAKRGSKKKFKPEPIEASDMKKHSSKGTIEGLE